VLPFSFVSFMAFGFVLVIVGANQVEMAQELSIDLSQTGLLAAVLALGMGVGVVGAGPLCDRFPRRRLFAIAFLIAAAALLAVERDMSYARWVAHLAVVGLGIGAYDTLVNAVVVQRGAAASPNLMTLVHSGASVGAIAGPPIIGFIASGWHWTASFHWIGVVHLALAVALLGVRFPAPPAHHDVERPALVTLLGPLAALGLVAFAYVGIESSVTAFARPYADSVSVSAERDRLAISAFWIGLFIGRLGVLGLRRALDASLLVVMGGVATLLVAIAVATATAQVGVAFLLVGIVLGCVYPVAIALAGQRAPGAEGTAAGIVAGAGALGGFAVPWLTGAIGDAGGIALGFGSLALWCAVLALGAAAARRPSRA
jgi:fucose permease